MKILVFTFLFILNLSYAQQGDEEKLIDEVLQDDAKSKLSFHEPNYILVGDDDLKLQVSIKYKVFKNTPLFFEYTQKMFWDVFKNSKPFRDVNYIPGLFYRFTIKNSWLKSIDTGIRHASNGRDGDVSRSMEQIYLRTTMAKKTSFAHLVSILEFYETLNEQSTNRNIKDHIGYYKLSLLLRNPFELKSFDLGISVFAGKDFVDYSQGAFEINFTYKLPFESFNPNILLQHYHGYAENLLEYDQKVSNTRLGFLFYI